MRRSLILVLACAMWLLPASIRAQAVDIDVVILADTSASMFDDVEALCGEVAQLQNTIRAGGLIERMRVLAITDSYNCATDSVRTLVDNSKVADDEDWGLALIELSGAYDWQPGAIRLMIVLSDAGPASGNPIDDPGPDREVIARAIRAAANNDIVLSMLIAQPNADVGALDRTRLETLARDMASATGGRVFVSSGPSDLSEAIVQLVRAAVETRAGLTAVAAAIPVPGKLSFDFSLLLTNAVLAALIVVLFGLTAALSDITFGARKVPSLPHNRVTDAARGVGARIAGFFDTLATPAAWTIGNVRVRRIATIVILFAFLALAGLIASFLDPEYEPRDVVTFLTMFAALTLVNFVVLFSRALAARASRASGALRIRPGVLLLIMFSVLISRAGGFLPGYLIGLPAAYVLVAMRAAAPEPNEATEERAIVVRPEHSHGLALGRASIVGAIAIALIAWLIAWPIDALASGLSGSVDSGVASVALTVTGGVESALLTIFLVGMQYALFELLPIGTTAGRAWFARQRLIWGVVFGVVLFGALHTLLNPGLVGTNALRAPGLILLGAILAVYSGVTLVFWLLNNESRLRSAKGLDRRATLIATILIMAWIGTFACFALSSVVGSVSPTTVLIFAAVAVALVGVRVFLMRRGAVKSKE